MSEIEMKRIKRTISFCVTAVLLGTGFLSCDRNNAGEEYQMALTEELPMAISQVTLPDKPATRAALDQTKHIGFYRSNENGYTAFNNKEGQYSSGKWIPVSGTVNLGQSTAKLAVYYPYDAAAGATIPLSVAVYDGDESIFLCAKRFDATNQSVYKTNSISLVLDHVYARLKITLARGNNYSANAKPNWTTLKVQNTAMRSNGTYNPLTDTYPGTSGNNYYEVTAMTGKVLGENPIMDLRLIPCTLGGGTLDITITVGGKLMSVSPAIPDGALQRGKQYNLTITVDPTGLTMSSISTLDWTSSTVSGSYETN